MRSSFDDAVLCFLRALFKILGIVLRPPLDAKPRRHTDGAADECDCDRPGFELGSHMSSPKCLAVNLDSYPGDVIPFGAEGVEQHGRCKRYARARYFGDHSVETQGSGAPCLRHPRPSRAANVTGSKGVPSKQGLPVWQFQMALLPFGHPSYTPSLMPERWTGPLNGG